MQMSRKQHKSMWYFIFNSSHLIPLPWNVSIVFLWIGKLPTSTTSCTKDFCVSHKEKNCFLLFVLDLPPPSFILNPLSISPEKAVYSSVFHATHKHKDFHDIGEQQSCTDAYQFDAIVWSSFFFFHHKNP